jgi:hypothetical protein
VSGRRRQKTGKQTAQKNKENVLYRIPPCHCTRYSHYSLQLAARGNKIRGAAIKNQLNTEIAACDKKQKEQEHKHAHDASHGVEPELKVRNGPQSSKWALDPSSKASLN